MQWNFVSFVSKEKEKEGCDIGFFA